MDYLKTRELYHYGIKGMKWGVRKEDYADVSKIASTAKSGLNDAASLIPENYKTVHPDYSEISSEELQRRVSRMNLEENYARLSGESKKIKSGSDRVREALQTIGSTIAILGAGAAIISTISGIKNRHTKQNN